LISIIPPAFLELTMRHLTQFDLNTQANTESRIELAPDVAGKPKLKPPNPET